MEEPLGEVGGSERLRSFHEDHGATFEGAGDRQAVAHYGRTERTHRAVRKGVGVTESPCDVIVLEGSDRVEYLDNVVTNAVPATDGEGCYALLLDPNGRIESDMYVYNAGERVLALVPPGVAETIVDGWETFIQDVAVRVDTDAFAVFGVHGPAATEKVASVLTGAGAPEGRLSFVRGSMGDAGVTVIRSDAPTGEVGYEVVCSAEDAPDVVDTLVNRGTNAVPFGRVTWRALTLEAGTPLFETELDGRIPNVAGVRNAVDYGKGCFVGQEVVSKVENRGRPSRRLVGLTLHGDELPPSGAVVSTDEGPIGEVTRAVRSPIRESPIAFATVDFEIDPDGAVTVGAAGGEGHGDGTGDGDSPVSASIEALPFVEGSEQSARIPTY